MAKPKVSLGLSYDKRPYRLGGSDRCKRSAPLIKINFVRDKSGGVAKYPATRF